MKNIKEKKANQTKDAPSKPSSASTEEVVELSDKEQVDILIILFRHKVHSVVGLHPESFNMILTS